MTPAREVGGLLRLSDLRLRDVINIVDGRRLGYIEDLEIDDRDGQIVALIVPGPPRLFGLLGRDRDLVVPWDRVLKIGEDVILVELRGLASWSPGRRHREDLE